MAVIVLHNGVVRTPKAFTRHRKRKSCILTKSREELYFETDNLVTTAVLPYDYCKEEKTIRFAEAGIPSDRCAFTPCGENKAKNLIKQGVLRDGDILIDDWNPNLYEARETGLDLILIKICTEESDSTKTWDGYRISSASVPEVIANTIKGIVLTHKKSA